MQMLPTFLQKLKTLGSTVAIKGLQVGEVYPFNGIFWNYAILRSLSNQTNNPSDIMTDQPAPELIQKEEPHGKGPGKQEFLWPEGGGAKGCLQGGDGYNGESC